jgi:DNA-binding NarL/FixJ family response regulator
MILDGTVNFDVEDGEAEEAKKNNNDDDKNDESIILRDGATVPKSIDNISDGETKFQRRNRRWVVIVDDEESIRLAVGDFLYDAGYQVSACADADSMLDLLLSPPSSSSLNGNHGGDATTNSNGTSSSSCTTKSNDTSRLSVRSDSDSAATDTSSWTPFGGNRKPQQQQQQLPDAIISDIRMPGSSKNGYELVQSIRVDPRISKIPIILLTAKAMTQDRIKGYQSGADVFLPKPFAPEELLSILDNLIERKEQRTTATTTTSGDGAAIPNSSPTNNNRNKAALPDLSDLLALKQDLDDIKEIMRRNAATTVKKTNVSLTDVERQVLELVCDGYTNSEIAFERGVGVVTINRIVQKLYDETKTRTRTELVKWAVTTGYVRP